MKRSDRTDEKRKVKTGRESGLVTKPIHKLKPMIRCLPLGSAKAKRTDNKP